MNRRGLYVGLSGFPEGLAMISKIKLIIMSLQSQGYEVKVMNRKKGNNSKYFGSIDNIEYTSVYRKNNSKSFIIRRLVNFLFPIMEWKKLVEEARNNEFDFIIVNTRNFFQILLYFFFKQVYNKKMLLTYVEYGKAMSTKSFISKIGDILFEKFAFKMADGLLPISEFLISIVKKNSNTPFLKTPVLTDIDYIDSVKVEKNENKFLFCGAAAFYEIIDLIVEAFEISLTENYNLTLVCNGSSKEVDKVKKRINLSNRSEQILLLNNITYEELIVQYKMSAALIIPLRSTLQDKARFPHKIGEYSASGRPIISNNYGEMSYYFENGKSAFLADNYSSKALAEKLCFVANNPIVADNVGIEGKKIADKYFSYKSYGKHLREFIEKI